MANTKELQNTVVLITGASRGIGAASAKLFASKGARVAVNYFGSEEAANEVVSSIKMRGGTAIAVRADVTDKLAVDSMVMQVTEELGAIDVLVLNASIKFPIKRFGQMQWEEFAPKVVGELEAAFHPCKAIVPLMEKRRTGCIIAVSTGLSRHPGEGFVAHSVAKSGLDAFVKSLALELGPKGIRVNAVAPGLVDTDATAFMPKERKDAYAQNVPLRRVATPDDIAGAIVLLCMEQSKYLTGVYLPVSGGMQMI